MTSIAAVEKKSIFCCNRPKMIKSRPIRQYRVAEVSQDTFSLRRRRRRIFSVDLNALHVFVLQLRNQFV